MLVEVRLGLEVFIARAAMPLVVSERSISTAREKNTNQAKKTHSKRGETCAASSAPLDRRTSRFLLRKDTLRLTTNWHSPAPAFGRQCPRTQHRDRKRKFSLRCARRSGSRRRGAAFQRHAERGGHRAGRPPTRRRQRRATTAPPERLQADATSKRRQKRGCDAEA